MRSVGLTVIALVCISLRTPAEAATLAAWVQLGPRGEVSARVITNDSACPTLRMDGAPLPMKARSDPEAVLAGVSKASFPVRGCEAVIAPGAQALLLDDRPLPLPRRELRRVVILGDTGCRLKGAFAIQDCNDPNAWPYAKIVAHAVAARPDLVIHLGDYHYRETACPAGWRGCEGSPFGFGWDAWNADFFAPSAPLFAAAPWLLVRGNHEDCERAGEGWFRLLAAVSLASRCGDLTGFFVTETGGMGFVVMDSASATDPSGDPQPLLRKLAAQFAEIRDTIPGESWLLTHRPMNALRSSPAGPDSVENRIQQAAIGDALPPSVRMIVSGHNHFFQALDFDGVRAPTRGRHRWRCAAADTARAVGRPERERRTRGGCSHPVWFCLHGVGPGRRGVGRCAVRRERQAGRTLHSGRAQAQLQLTRTQWRASQLHCASFPCIGSTRQRTTNENVPARFCHRACSLRGSGANAFGRSSAR